MTVSLTKLNRLKNKIKKKKLKINLIALFLLKLSFIINLDKIFILKINNSLDSLEWKGGQEFPDRNTFLFKFIQDRVLSREIYYENSKSLIFYALFVSNFVLNDVLFFILLCVFDLFLWKVFIFKTRKKKKIALQLKFIKTKIARIELIQIKITIIILSYTIFLFTLRALYLFINDSIFFIKL